VLCPTIALVDAATLGRCEPGCVIPGYFRGSVASTDDQLRKAELMLWVPNRSSICGELRIVVDQSAEPVVASQAKGRMVMRP
jgi:hypothetical protein